MADIRQPNYPQPDHNETARDESISDEMLARRRLLKLGVYVPPAVLGMMIVGGMPTPAQAVVGSCCPSACNPCIELAAGGETEKGGFEPFSKKECRKKWRKCNKKRRKLRKKGIKCGPAPNPC